MMKKRKRTLEYKLKSWCNIFVGISIIIHCVIFAIMGGRDGMLIGLVVSVLTLMCIIPEIASMISNEKLDSVSLQFGLMLFSHFMLYHCDEFIPVKVGLIMLVIEVVIFLLGVLCVYLHHRNILFRKKGSSNI